MAQNPIRQGHVGYTETLMLTVIALTTKFLWLPRVAAEHAGTAAWLLPLLNAVVSSIFFWFIVSILDPGSDESVTRQYEKGAGLAGTLLLAGIFLEFLLLLGLILRRYAGETRTVILPNTPIIVVEALALGAAVYGASLGLETLGRAAMLYAIPLGLTVGGFILVTAPHFRITGLLPLLGFGPRPLLIWGAKAGLFRETWLILIMWPYLRNRRDGPKAGLGAIWLAALILVVVTAAVEMSHPALLAARFPFPVAELARSARLGIYVSNLESIFTFLLLFIIFLTLAVVLWMTATLAADLLHLAEYRPLLPILTLGAWMVAYLPETLPESLEWADEYVRSLASLVTYPLIPLVWFLARRRRQDRGKRNG